MDISRWISDAAARTPASTAVRFEDSELSYSDLERRVAALAGVLGCGAASGDQMATRDLLPRAARGPGGLRLAGSDLRAAQRPHDRC
jgi:non-ribosomal peptide synthetase component F